MSKAKIILQVSGSISAFKSISLASMLVKAGYEVQPILSDGAKYFVGESSYEGITGKEVLMDQFERGKALDHINLADWADLILLYPASANRIANLRAGMAGDLIGSLFLANNFRKPYWVSPAMNTNMFEHPATAESLKILEQWGTRILPTGEGRMACGTTGKGRLLEPEELFPMIEEHFTNG
jgi:phosphopantothenoylcysteine synthetase/decarboxylase